METQNNAMPCKCILIIEDEKAIRDSLQLFLEFEGYKVYSAPNGREGLEILPKLDLPCLILLDLMMPVMNGWEFIAALEKNMMLAPIPVVVLTAFSDKAKAINAKQVLKKPIDLEILLKVVSQYCKLLPR
jgi:CheY-like chemotaxis protein